jgi:uncharacterized protein (DUF2147 family)
MSHAPFSAPLLGAALAALLLTAGPALAQKTPAAPGTPAASAPPGPIGEWLVAKRIARIRIVDCDDRLWGVVTWEAKPGVDSKNPNPNLRSRPTLGMPVLLGMTRSKPYQWDGEIYNAQDGHTYSASISLLGPNTLRVQGCFLSILCGGENWTRVETPPQDETPNASPPPPARPEQSKQSKSSKQPGKTAKTAKAAKAAKPADTSQADEPDPNSDEAVCLRLFGPARLPHERRLK